MAYPTVRYSCIGEVYQRDYTYAFCSGVLLNNSTNDFRPLIYTARHCITGWTKIYDCLPPVRSFAEFSSSVVRFNFQSPLCSQLSERHPREVNFEMLGMSLIDEEYNSDQALLELREKPPIQYNVYYAGWNRDKHKDLPSDKVTAIHHPKGDVKKISKGTSYQRFFLGIPYNYFSVDWHDGVTEKGSSGSPLFCDGDNRVIGTLSWGINDDCDDFNERDRYSRLRVFWDDVKDDLAPNDQNRNKQEGSDPISSCLQNIEINGNVFPGGIYRASKNDLTIQGGSIVIANRLSTPFRIIYSSPAATLFYPEYDIVAENSIQVQSGYNRRAQIPWGSTISLKIGSCQTFTGCGINYDRVAPETNPEESLDNIKSNDAFPAELLSFSIYPNPAKNEAFIDLSSLPLEPLVISLKTPEGVVLSSKKILNNNIVNVDLTNLSSGLYFVVVANEHYMLTKKLIVE